MLNYRNKSHALKPNCIATREKGDVSLFGVSRLPRKNSGRGGWACFNTEAPPKA